jgi:hypothetical protein
VDTLQYDDWDLPAGSCLELGALRDDRYLFRPDTFALGTFREPSYGRHSFRTHLDGDVRIRLRGWWADHHVKDKTHGTKTLHHPLVGPLTLQYEHCVYQTIPIKSSSSTPRTPRRREHPPKPVCACSAPSTHKTTSNTVTTCPPTTTREPGTGAIPPIDARDG